jgi:hypothetical protein
MTSGVNSVGFGVAPETRTLNADLRWVLLSSLRVGDTLIAIDEEKGQPFNSSANAYRRWRLSTVEAITECVLPAVKIVMVDGTVFVCSTRHSWLAPSSGTSVWSESRFLRSGKVYPGSSKITKILDVWQEDRSWEAGYLAAGVDGEGHLTQFDNPGRGHSKQLRLGFSQRENAMLAAFNLAADALGFKFCRAGSLNFALTGGKSKTLEFLGRVRPRRLLAKFDPARIGTVHRMANVPVETVEHIGEQKLTARRGLLRTIALRRAIHARARAASFDIADRTCICQTQLRSADSKRIRFATVYISAGLLSRRCRSRS